MHTLGYIVGYAGVALFVVLTIAGGAGRRH